MQEKGAWKCKNCFPDKGEIAPFVRREAEWKRTFPEDKGSLWQLKHRRGKHALHGKKRKGQQRICGNNIATLNDDKV